MDKDVPQKLSKVIQIDEDQIQQHLGDWSAVLSKRPLINF
jgi:hypothetical protein